MLEGIIVGLTVVAIASAAKRLWPRRGAALQTVKERACRHEWEPVNKPGRNCVIVSGYREWCKKCGASR